MIKNLYNRLIRPYTPYKISVHNGVPVKNVVRLFDRTSEFPQYESNLIDQIKEIVRYGDSIIIVGGGLGVSSVVAAQRTVEEDTVRIFEGGINQYEQIKDTIKLNRVSAQCSVRHAVVGENVGVYSGTEDADQISPKQLSSCNVLILDCEGAETKIIEEMNIRPDSIIVETHAFLGAPKEEVITALKNKKYEIVDCKTDNPDNGIYILTAMKNK